MPSFRFRLLSCLVPLITAASVAAQKGGDEGLTQDFSRLSAKERTRLAREEQEGSRKDTAYQAVMAGGEEHFQNGRYNDALTSFQTARTMRPLNVYPKVKIEDLQALIHRRDSIASAAVPEPVIKDQEPVEAPAEIQKTIPKPIVKEQVNNPPPLVEKKLVRPVAAPAATRKEEPPAPLTDGVSENRYKQGNAEVTELTVTELGRTTRFKRVKHPWGQVFYFEDGQAIDPRVWKERFGERP